MKKNVIVRIVLLSLTALILTGILLWGLNVGGAMDWTQERLGWGGGFGGWSFGFSHLYDNADSYTIGSGSVEADEITDLEINWISGSVDIDVYDGDVITFTEPEGLKEDYQLRYRVSGGKLIIQFCKPSWTFGFVKNPSSKQLTMQIPRSMLPQLNEVDLSVTSAKVTAESLQANICEVDNVSGELTFRNCTFGNINVDTVSGGLDYTGTVETVDFDGVSSNLKLDLNNTPREVQSDVVSGEVRMTLPKDSAFSARLDTVSGKLTCEFPTTSQGETIYCGTGGGTYEFDSVSGGVSILMAP